MATFKFDKGPTATWAQKFFDAPRQHYVTHPSGRFRTEFGQVYYRGRLNSSVKVSEVTARVANDAAQKINVATKEQARKTA